MILEDSLMEGSLSEKDTRPIYKKQKDAENYKNEIYKKEEKKRKKRFEMGKVELGKLEQDFAKLTTGKNLENEIKNLGKRIGKLPLGSSTELGKRLRDIAEQEVNKRRKTIFMDDIPTKAERTKKKSKVLKPTSPVSSSSSSPSNLSIKSSDSEKSSGNLYD